MIHKIALFVGCSVTMLIMVAKKQKYISRTRRLINGFWLMSVCLRKKQIIVQDSRAGNSIQKKISDITINVSVLSVEYSAKNKS